MIFPETYGRTIEKEPIEEEKFNYKKRVTRKSPLANKNLTS